MRIVHVVRQFAPGVGGLEEVVGRLAELQARAGLDVRVVTLDRIFADPGVRLVARDSWMGADVVRIPWRGSPRYPLAPSVLSHIRDADIVHVHAIDFFFDFLALTKVIHGKPLVATTHGGFFHTKAHGGLKRIWFSTVTRASVRAYAAIVACSASDFAMFEKIAPGNLTTIENGVDIGKFADRASPSPVKRMVTIGRFSENKRYDRLLDAMAELVRRDAEWRLDIVGAESDWSAARMRKEVASRALDANVCVHVRPGIDEMAAIVSRSSLFVSASEHEGFGLSLIEAASAGLGVVAHGNEAFLAFAKQCPDIAIADFAQPDAAAQAIETAFARLIEDPGSRARMIAAAQRYDWPDVAARYLETYRRALSVSA